MPSAFTGQFPMAYLQAVEVAISDAFLKAPIEAPKLFIGVPSLFAVFQPEVTFANPATPAAGLRVRGRGC